MKNKKIAIPISGQFSGKECLWYLNRDFDECIYTVSENKVRRAFKSGNEIMLVDVYTVYDKLVVEWLNVHPSDEQIVTVQKFVSDWFDVDANLSLFYTAIVRDKRVAYMAKEYEGLRLIGIPDLFEALAWCIIGQQINLFFAHKVKRKLVERYGDSIQFEGERYYVFPSADVLSNVNVSDLRKLQFSEKKAEYLITLAKTFLNGKLSKELLLGLPNLESRIKYLTDIRGIGQWTANYALMKCLREPTCIPHGDAGLLNSLINHRIIKTKDDRQSIDKFFKSFAGCESYMVFYLWRALSQPKQ